MCCFLLKCHFCGISCDHDEACEKTESCCNRYSRDDESYFTFHSVLLSELCIKGEKRAFVVAVCLAKVGFHCEKKCSHSGKK